MSIDITAHQQKLSEVTDNFCMYGPEAKHLEELQTWYNNVAEIFLSLGCPPHPRLHSLFICSIACTIKDILLLGHAQS